MKEWYLLNSNTTPNSLGGYENEAYVDYRGDAFLETLQTDIATTVTLYNYDRTESQEIRCIVQDNVANTQLKSIERSVLAPIGTLKAGMYIFFEDVYWLISGYPGNNGMYEKATIILCQLILKWQDDTGKVIERPANFTSAAKYDTGTNGNSYLTLTSNNFTIWLPDDDGSSTLYGKRVFIDRNVNNPWKVFKITRADDALYLFGENHGGILSFIADKDEINLKVDRPDLGLCNYNAQPETPPTENDITITFSHRGNKEIVTGGNAKTFTATATDKDGNVIEDFSPMWQVISMPEFESFVEYEIDADNRLKLSAKYNTEMIGSMIKLIVEDTNYNVSSSIYITVGGGI